MAEDIDKIKKGYKEIDQLHKTVTAFTEKDGEGVFKALTGWLNFVPVVGSAFAGITNAVFDYVESNQYVMQTAPLVGEVWNGLSTTAGSFQANISNATGVLNGFSQAFAIGGAQQLQLADQMSSVQSQLADNIRMGVDAQGEAAQAGIQEFQRLFDSMVGIGKEQINVQTGYQQIVRAQAASIAEQGQMTEEQASQIIKSARDTRQASYDIINQQFEQEKSLLEQKYGKQGELNRQAYDEELSLARERKAAALDTAYQTYHETVDIAQTGYLQQNDALQGSLSNMLDVYKKIDLAKQAQVNVERLYAEDVDNIAVQNNAQREEHNAYLAKLWDDLTGTLDTETQKQLGAMLGMSEGIDFASLSSSEDIEGMAEKVIGALQELGLVTEDYELLTPMVETTAEDSALLQDLTQGTVSFISSEYQSIPTNTEGVMDATYDPMIASEQEKGAILTADTQMHTDGVATDINALPEETLGAMDATMDPMVEASATKGAQVEGNLEGMTDNSAADLNALPGETAGSMSQVLQNQLNAIYGQSGPLLSALFGLTGGITGDVNGMPGEVQDPLGAIFTAFVNKILASTPWVTDEIGNMVNRIMVALNGMSSGASGIMNNVMSGMLSAMRSRENEIYAKAAAIAAKTLERLRHSFDINSPSRKTRAIFNSVMEGAQMGLSDRTEALMGQTEGIASGVLGGLHGLAGRARATVAREMGGAQPAALWAGAASRLDALAGRGEELGLFRQMAEGLQKGNTQVEADLVLDGQAFGRLVTRLSDRGLGNRMRNTARLGVEVT